MYDFSTLYTTIPRNLIKEKLNDLIERTLNREGSLYLAYNGRNAFPKTIEIIPCGHVRKCVKLSLFYWTIFL